MPCHSKTLFVNPPRTVKALFLQLPRKVGGAQNVGRIFIPFCLHITNNIKHIFAIESGDLTHSNSERFRLKQRHLHEYYKHTHTHTALSSQFQLLVEPCSLQVNTRNNMYLQNGIIKIGRAHV